MTSYSGKWIIPSSCQVAYDSDGAKFGTATTYSQIKLDEKITNPCSVEFTLVDYYYTSLGASPVLIFQYTNGETTPNQLILTRADNNNDQYIALDTTINHAFIKGAKYKIDYDSSTLKVYENGVEVATGSNNVGLPTRFEFHVGNSRGRAIKIKDVKVKPL